MILNSNFAANTDTAQANETAHLSALKEVTRAADEAMQDAADEEGDDATEEDDADATAAPTNLEELEELLQSIDGDEPFPRQALRMGRGKGTKRQKVRLPDGYLDQRDDDTPPKGPHSLEEIRAWEQALNGG